MKILVRAALGALALVALVLLALLLQPRLLLNSRTAAYAARRFGAGYRPSWERLSLTARSPGLLTKRLVLEAGEFCVDAPDLSAVGCLETLVLDATVKLGRPLVSVRRVERLKLRVRDLRVEVPAAGLAAKKSAEKDEERELIPAWAARMTLGTVEIDAPRAVIASSSGTTVAGLTARFRSSEPGPLRAELYAVRKGTGPAAGQRWDASLVLDSDLFRAGKLTRLDATARVRGGGLGLDASARIEPGDGVHALKGAVALTSALGGLRRAALEGCAGKASTTKLADLETADLSCRVVLQPARLGIGPGPLPKALTGTLTASTGRRARFGRRARYATKAAARVGPAKGYGGFLLTLDADLEGPESALAANGRARAGAAIADFGELVKFLDGTGYAFPAPLNALDGALSAEASVESRAGEPRRQVEFGARTDLTSPKQALKAELKGSASVPSPGAGGKVKVDAEIDLKKVVFQLPYLELKGTPAPVPDKRIKTGDPARDAAVDARHAGVAKPAPAPADYDFTVRTSSPVVLLTNLLKSPVPVSIDIRARPAGASGTVKIESFDMKVLRQNARVDHITLKPGAPGAPAEIDGKLVYKRNAVTVDILILGTTAKPTVVFESDPPMSQNEIVALLLYGKSPDELDADQKSSAGNASAAMTSGAFGLASLFLFASTPVESVSYDAASSSYEVKFKLPGGATLAVGSNLKESKTLGLRKRLARHWEIQTEADSGEGERGAITTFLQWFERY